MDTTYQTSSKDDELVSLRWQNSFLKALAAAFCISFAGMAIGSIVHEKSHSNSLDETIHRMTYEEEDFVWTKLGLEQISFENWRDFSGDSEDSLFIKNFPFPGEDFTTSHLNAWKVHIDNGVTIQNLLNFEFIMSRKDRTKAKEIYHDYKKIPSTYSNPIVIEESLIDYRLQFAADIGSTMIGETASKGRLVSPAGRRLREHFYRFPDQCDATPIALEVFLRLMMYVSSFIETK